MVRDYIKSSMRMILDWKTLRVTKECREFPQHTWSCVFKIMLYPRKVAVIEIIVSLYSKGPYFD